MCGTEKYLPIYVVNRMDDIDEKQNKNEDIEDDFWELKQNLLFNDMYALLVSYVELNNYPDKNSQG